MKTGNEEPADNCEGFARVDSYSKVIETFAASLNKVKVDEGNHSVVV